jgi:hypothetical protein
MQMVSVSATEPLTAQRKAYAANRFWHRIGRAGFWRLFGNTLPLGINLRYLRYGKFCRAQAGQEASNRGWPFSNQNGFIVQNAMPRDQALSMVERVSAQIAEGTITPDKDLPFNISVPNSLTFFGTHLLEIFDGVLGDAIRDVMRSQFRIEWLQYYRTIPGEPDKSWLWHIDNDPPYVLKALLYLTDTTIENGATRILSQQDTRSLFKQGYFGVFGEERQAEIDLPESSQQAIEVRAGDVLLFSPNQLHKGGEVHRGFRDTLSFLILPSPIGWREDANQRGMDYLHSASGFPEDPSL